MTDLRWLHLSDWHQKGRDFDRTVVRDALIKDIRQRKLIDPSLEHVDFVIFSGDLAYCGQALEFEEARKQLLDPVLKEVGLEPDRLFMVPGNHDLDREYIKKWLPPALQTPLTEDADVHEWLDGNDERQKTLEPFKQYRTFVTEYTGQNSPDYASILRLNVAGKDISLLGLNSAWMCGRHKDSQGEVDDDRHILVGEPQIHAALQQISDADVKIAVLHHPLEWLAEFDRKRIKSRLLNDCHFILHGHEHQSQVQIINSTAGQCVIIPAGASYDRRVASHPRYTNAYNWVSLDFATGQGTVYLRCWAEQAHKWRADIDAHEKGYFPLKPLPKLLACVEPVASGVLMPKSLESADLFIFTEKDSEPRTSIPHNLPSLLPFFGREEELCKIAAALNHKSRTWGALIDGPGGMGKTSLAVRAAYDARPEDFNKIVFVSLKARELDDDGVRDLSGFLISGLAELLNELAGELGRAEIAKAVEDQRPRILLDALHGTQTLLVLDNLESLLKPERDTVFTFVKKLPPGCKAILTSRARIGLGAEELILEKLDEAAALQTIAKLAENNPALSKSSKAERLILYEQTGGKPLLLRWTAGQVGRGTCLTLSDAVNYLRSCPEGNDPLEFIFGDLIRDFSEVETRVLCALTYFTLPAKVEHIRVLVEPNSVFDKESQEDSAELGALTNPFDTSRTGQPLDATLNEATLETALKTLTNRSLLVPSDEFKTFTLIPLVGDFLRKKKPEIVAETAHRLEIHAHALLMENGFENYERFSILDAAWPIIAAALPLFLLGPDERLQRLCGALWNFFDCTGRLDEWLALSRDAESCAIKAKNFWDAGWRAYHAGRVHNIRAESDEVLACADRAEAHWRKAQNDQNATKAHDATKDLPYAIRLRGLGYKLARDLPSAIAAINQSLDLWRAIKPESLDVAIGLNDLADLKRLSDDLEGAESDSRESIRISRAVNYQEGVVNFTGNFVEVLIDRRDWKGAELLAREALSLAEKLGRQHSIGGDCRHLAIALQRQGKTAEALPFARRAVEILTRLGSRYLASAQQTLTECESQKSGA